MNRSRLWQIFRIAILMVLAGKILNWFFNFNPFLNYWMNATMFCLIAIAYLFIGFAWDNRFIKAIFIFCGVFLIGMNFLPDQLWRNVVGIACLLGPILIGRFAGNESKKIAA
jgi:predicted acyltransferase